MRLSSIVTGTLAVILSCQPASAQGTVMVPTGDDTAAPVPQGPAADPKDTPAEIAKDAARDLKDNRFYNKPGATRAQYDGDWQTCRLIARGSRTPTGSIPYFYNPAVISPLAAGVGAGIGGAIAAAIAEGQQRRANRQNCLLIKGWRLVEADAETKARMATMSDADKSAHFDAIVGVPTVSGEVTERTRFSSLDDPALGLDSPMTGTGSVFLGKKVDAGVPVKLAPGEAAIVMSYRRSHPASAGRSAAVQLLRYDMAARDVVYRPRDWKKKGDKTTYSLLAGSGDKKASLEVQVHRVTPGDYVIGSTGLINMPMTRTFCFGAPTFAVAAGEVVYIGDFVPFINAETSTGGKISELFHTNRIDDAREALAAKQPELAAAMKPAALRNRATFACAGAVMDRWDMNGIENLAEPEPARTVAAATSAG